MENSTKKVFISHSSIDKDVCDSIVNQLILSGISKDAIFYSSDDETGVQGPDFPDEILMALDCSRFNIVVLSKHYMKSKPCLNEAGIAWFLYKRKGIPVFFIAVKGFYGKQFSGLMNSGNCHFNRIIKPHTIERLCGQAKQALSTSSVC